VNALFFINIEGFKGREIESLRAKPPVTSEKTPVAALGRPMKHNAEKHRKNGETPVTHNLLDQFPHLR
jgi:hypothetical protein